MSNETAQFEQRLSSVEAAMAQVQQKLGLAPPGANWVEQISGSLADIPEGEYQQFLDCCRAVRTGSLEDRSHDLPAGHGPSQHPST